MRAGVIVIAAAVIALCSYSIYDLRRARPAPAAAGSWYREEAGRLESSVQALCNAITERRPPDQIQRAFLDARLAYKRTELLTEYFLPYTAHFINGPNLPEVEPDEKDVVVNPEGFQVLEALLFPSLQPEDTAALRQEALRLQGSLHRLTSKADKGLPATDAQLFDAMRQELLRISSLGISGFDSPEAQYSLPEAAAALQGVETVWRLYAPRLQEQHPALAAQTQELLTGAQQTLLAADFNTLDRLHFISYYMNRLLANLKQGREALHIPYQPLPHLLDPAASHPFAKGAFNPMFYAPDQTQAPSPVQTELGRRLFYDPVLSYNGQRSCATCHNPQKAFTDGMTTPAALPGEAPIIRNTPTILNAALQPGLFYDQRVAYLEDQVNMVVHNKAEMHGSLAGAAVKLQQQPDYRQLFQQAFHITPDKINGNHIQQAIASYIRSLVKLNSPFDAFMQGDTTRLEAAAKRGFSLFMGKAKCGTCHFMPLFNGVAPPDFTKAEAEILGVPAAKGKAIIDADEGKYNVHKIAIHRYAFKTPTLRNVALTAPYMHNGVFSTLEEVMEFYNNGGGAGMGIPLASQTLPADSLHLTQQEQQDVIAFMRALTDTSATPD